MKKEKKLSIIIPHFNCPAYLRTLLLSIPNISDIQVIVVDDKSTEHRDEYEKVKRESAGKNIEFYDNDGVKSAGSCRNIGLRHAVGEWLLFADADDYFTDGFYDVVTSYLNSDYDLVFFAPTSVVMGTEKISDRHLVMSTRVYNYVENPDWKNTLVLRYEMIGPCSRLIRRAMVVENEIWFEEIIASNDVMFAVKCGYAAKKITVDTRVIYCITKHAGSLTTQLKEEVLDARMGSFLRRFLFLKERLSVEEMNVLHMNENGRNRILNALQNGYALRKVCKVAREYHKCGIRLWGQDLFIRPWHCLRIIYDSLQIRKKNKDIWLHSKFGNDYNAKKNGKDKNI